MYMSMDCPCGASLQVDGSDEEKTLVDLYVHRFASAHVDCGLLSPLEDTSEKQPESESRPLQRKPKEEEAD